MNLTQFVKSLLPRFSKNRVLEDARLTRTEMQTVSIPSYLEAEKLFKNWKFNSPKMKEFEKVFKRNVDTVGGDNIVVSIRKGLQNVLKNHELSETRLEAYLESDVIADGISCVKANLLRVIEASSFISKFSTRFLNYVYILETAELSVDPTYVKMSLTPAEIQIIEKSFIQFCVTLNALDRTEQNFVKALALVPDVTLGFANIEAIVATMGEDKIDPLQLQGISSTSANPIYHIGLMVAEWQANRYKTAVETKKVLELRLLNLQLAKEKKPDANLEKEIEYIQKRIKSLDERIQKQEEAMAND